MGNNVLNSHAYDPIFYANEAVIALNAALGMASAVHRGYSPDSANKGSVIEIRVPNTFVEQDAPAPAQDLAPGFIQVPLKYWKEVKIALSDKEASLTDTRLIEDHIRPMAVALATGVDTALNALYKDIPWYYDLSGTPAVSDITGTRKILQQNFVPLNDSANMFLEIDPTAEEGFLNLSAFSQNQGAGQTGVETQIDGNLGRRFGFNTFTNQNVASHVSGTASTGTLAVNQNSAPTGYAAGVTIVNLDAVSVTGTLVPGDTLAFAGHTQRYSVRNTVTASGNAFASVEIFPALKAPIADNEVVTVSLDTHVANLAFHRSAFALATAPLTESGNGLGAQIATVADPVTNLSLRARRFYDGNLSKEFMALDILYGLIVIDPNRACRLRG